MHSMSAKLDSRIRNHRLFEFPVSWSDELIFPYYDGLSLPNVTHSIAEILGVPLPHSSPLLPEVWQQDVPHAKRVVLFLMDGMGYQHLNQLIEDDPELHDAVLDLNMGRNFVPLSSIAPSTTAVALTSLWTGATPSETGITGTLMFLRELSLLNNMLTFTPLYGRHPQDVVADWGITPENVVKSKGMIQHLEENGVPAYIVTHKQYVGTGLSRILHRGGENIITHKGQTDFMHRVRSVLEDTRDEHCYVGIYWDAVDALAHEYGVDSPIVSNEIREKIFALRDLSFRRDAMGDETLFILMADHGHKNATNRIDLAQDELLYSAMQMSLCGDERHAYMYLRHGTMEVVKERIESHYAESLTYIESHKAIKSGYFGKNPSPELQHRIGDLILLPRSGYILSDPYLGSLPMISRHAGLTDDEMLIPFIWKLS